MKDLLLELKNITIKQNQQTILDNINLKIYKNEIVTIIGPNGAGKTTLLRTLLSLVQPTTGTVWKKNSLTIGYVPQKLQLNPNLPITVKRFLKLIPHITTEKIMAIANEIGITAIQNNSMHTLSGGELQRVLIARALLHTPELLILDEPAQGVDINGQAELYQLINRASHQYQCGVLMVSHDLNLVMAKTDQVICLNQHICCSGQPEQISNDPAFIELFGKNATNLAIYHHHHDHQHTPDGHIVQNNHCDHNHA